MSLCLTIINEISPPVNLIILELHMFEQRSFSYTAFNNFQLSLCC